MSDVTLTQQQQPDKLPRSETRADRVTPRVRKAVLAMVWDGLPYNEAATENGLTVRAMRLALARPHVMALLKAEREVLRGSAGARNIHRLCEIRDAADNMPAVNAIKALEQLGEERSNSGSNAAVVPGFAIVIVQPGASVTADYQQIDAKPLQTNTFGPTARVGTNE